MVCEIYLKSISCVLGITRTIGQQAAWT